MFQVSENNKNPWLYQYGSTMSILKIKLVSVNNELAILHDNNLNKTLAEDQIEEDSIEEIKSNPLNKIEDENNNSATNIEVSDQNQNNTLCAICGQYLNLLSKNPEQLCKCKECGALFTTQNDLRIHENNGIKYQCGTCRKMFSCKITVQEKLQTSPQEKVKPLKISRNRAKLKVASTQRLPELNAENQCKDCGKSFSSESTLKRHLKAHSKVMICDRCGKGFSTEDFLVHNKSSRCSKKQTVFKCKECKKIFSQKGTLNMHMNTHTKPFSCNECGKAFSLKRSLEQHQSSRKCALECIECQRSFSNKDDLKKHIRSHNSFECKECGKSFTTKTLLWNHEQIHIEIKAYHCDTCGKSFSTPGYLRSHQKVHEHPMFNCEECGKSFPFKRSLERHLNTHKGIKPFKCNVCGKCFSQKNNLVTHMKCHAEERPFQCQKCGKGFKMKHNLKEHNDNVKCTNE